MSKLVNERLYKSIKDLIDQSRTSIARHVNTTMVFTYFHIGRIIVEDEQRGAERAGYAKQILLNLSVKLNEQFGKGYSVDNLESMRLFYLEYGNSETPSRNSEIPFALSWSHYVQLLKIKDVNERNFYEVETLSNNWSVRELKRQYHSSLFERLALSKDRGEVHNLSPHTRVRCCQGCIYTMGIPKQGALHIFKISTLLFVRSKGSECTIINF